ncbi:MAG: hypothetical protein ACLFPQ_04385 [Candidatus Woesearchaeota archaeon]
MAEELEFYDVKSGERFKTTDYRVEEKTSESKKTGKMVTRYFAVTKSPSGSHECWKILGKDMAAKLKNQ